MLVKCKSPAVDVMKPSLYDLCYFNEFSCLCYLRCLWFEETEESRWLCTALLVCLQGMKVRHHMLGEDLGKRRPFPLHVRTAGGLRSPLGEYRQHKWHQAGRGNIALFN